MKLWLGCLVFATLALDYKYPVYEEEYDFDQLIGKYQPIVQEVTVQHFFSPTRAKGAPTWDTCF